MSDEIVYITAEGLERLKEELTYLKKVRRPEISTKLQLAIAEGDLRENADYQDAKEQQSFVEGRIMDLEDSLRRTQVIREDRGTDMIRVGSTVTIAEVGFEDEEEEEIYRIVGVHEADPSKGMISNLSPIGSALLGKKKGQTVTVTTPRGQTQFKVLKIE